MKLSNKLAQLGFTVPATLVATGSQSSVKVAMWPASQTRGLIGRFLRTERHDRRKASKWTINGERLSRITSLTLMGIFLVRPSTELLFGGKGVGGSSAPLSILFFSSRRNWSRVIHPFPRFQGNNEEKKWKETAAPATLQRKRSAGKVRLKLPRRVRSLAPRFQTCPPPRHADLSLNFCFSISTI